MDPLLKGTFEVRCGRKRREYSVSLLQSELEMRPVDFSQVSYS